MALHVERVGELVGVEVVWIDRELIAGRFLAEVRGLLERPLALVV